MALRFPESMDEVFYYTDRELENGGEITVWVFKKTCPNCGAIMSKPRSKTGRPIKKADYVCQNCGMTMTPKEYEADLIANVRYTCPNCKHKGEKQQPFKRKMKQGVPTLVVTCDNCGYEMLVTKKFKKPKSKK